MKKKNSRLGDWGLKLLALALALVIYHTLKTEKQDSNQKENDHSFFRAR